VGIVFTCLFALALAEEPAESSIEINRVADIYPHLPPPGARRWDPSELVAAVKASDRRWSPNDVYELIDRQAHEEVIKAVASEVGLFYDGSQKPLQDIAAEARAGAPAETVVVDGDIGALFDWFDGVFAERAKLEEQVGIPNMKGANETQHQYERRMRAHEEKRVATVGPVEGKIQAATFEVTLPAATANVGGCERPVAVGDASSVDFDRFREVAGTRQAETLVQLTSHSIEKLMFAVAPKRRLEAWGRCGRSGSTLKVTMKRSADGAWTANGDFR